MDTKERNKSAKFLANQRKKNDEALKFIINLYIKGDKTGELPEVLYNFMKSMIERRSLEVDVNYRELYNKYRNNKIYLSGSRIKYKEAEEERKKLEKQNKKLEKENKKLKEKLEKCKGKND